MDPDNVVMYATAVVTFLQVIISAWKKFKDAIGK